MLLLLQLRFHFFRIPEVKSYFRQLGGGRSIGSSVDDEHGR